jgi:hypothetical protein
MGLRESIGRHPYRAISLVSVVLALAGVVLASQMRNVQPAPTQVASAYFTVDDGKSFFVDDAGKVSPFDHDGKEAVLAHVFACKDGKRFVGYLERATNAHARDEIENAGRQLLEDGKHQAVPMPSSDVMDRIRNNSEVKRPGDKVWVPVTSQNAGPIYAVICPGGSGDKPSEIQP